MRKRFHASCSNLGDNELVRIESGDGATCTTCKADCGLCSGAVLKGHKAVRCGSCDMWIHNECSFIAETQYETVDKLCVVEEFTFRANPCIIQTVHGFARNVNSSTSLIPSLVNR